MKKGFTLNILSMWALMIIVLMSSVDLRAQEPSSDAATYYNQGNAYCKEGQYDKGIYYYNKAIEIAPKFSVAYNNRAIGYYYKKEYEKAWDDVHKAQNMGYEVHPGFLNALRKASGRDR